MNEPVKDGDKITVVDHVRDPSRPLFTAVVIGPTFTRADGVRSFRWHDDNVVGGWTDDSEEGVVWIRGHHQADSPEAFALIAARSLA